MTEPKIPRSRMPITSALELKRSIHVAIKQGNADEALSLIGQDQALLNVMTPFGTWLHVAAEHGRLEIARRLVELGLSVHVRGGTFDGDALGLAASYGHLDIVDYLHSQGAEFDVGAPERNPLFSAIYNGHLHVVRFLIERGIDIRVKYSGKLMRNMDALAFARERGQLEIAEVLVQHLRADEVQPHSGRWT